MPRITMRGTRKQSSRRTWSSISKTDTVLYSHVKQKAANVINRKQKKFVLIDLLLFPTRKKLPSSSPPSVAMPAEASHLLASLVLVYPFPIDLSMLCCSNLITAFTVGVFVMWVCIIEKNIAHATAFSSANFHNTAHVLQVTIIKQLVIINHRSELLFC